MGFLLVEDDLSDTVFDVVLIFELILLEAVEAVEAVEVVLWPLPVEVDPVDTDSDDDLVETVLLLEAVLLPFDVDVTATIVTTVGCQLADLDTEVITSEFDGQGSSILKKLTDVGEGVWEEVAFAEVVEDTTDDEGFSLSPARWLVSRHLV